MASQFTTSYPRAASRATIPPLHNPRLQNPHFVFTKESQGFIKLTRKYRPRMVKSWKIHASSGGDSYLEMWKKAMERERKSQQFEQIAKNVASDDEEEEGDEKGAEVLTQEDWEQRSRDFQKILEVPAEERDKVQRMQTVDRAAAAIAAARALLKENVKTEEESTDFEDGEGAQRDGNSVLSIRDITIGTPGPDFWSWTPPSDDDHTSNGGVVKLDPKASSSPARYIPLMEKERSADFLLLPFESRMFQNKAPLPPLQSLVEGEEQVAPSLTQETSHLEDEQEIEVSFSAHAVEAVQALQEASEVSSQGVYPDGSRWWKETGLETRADGVVCRWTLTRGVSSDKAVEWEEKYWEAADDFGYKELGSEKSGRDSTGNVWREYWRESMSQNGGIVTLEKTADKWGKNGKGDEWQEQWWEHYGAGGYVDKWAHKWCSLDTNTPLDDGHAHVWHERWGEKYDGQGGSTKYTDKWAERFVGDGWDKWGDKWDENFDPYGNGVKQGETWWQGKHGDRWNRTWGERHNGSGWVHKYGKSSSGEHWDTHVQQDTWYERFPHFGFYHCFENSVQLREVKKPSEWSESKEIEIEE
ncbi:OLC1v1019910C1 [Oldenlandia corymbosa var. corymbosa]|uniref:OLC1v1019910C1 n=1 Tax=Oldenlandia corymbosa var. corymbosa TaxID=529605 RepID=A0AAV1EFK1_OLDCO|nr:OLC1v1019910C1 [Oldenlandia corymbosa var. corymbosa]